MNYNTIKYNVNEGIATLTLNQPPENIMSLLFFEELLNVCTTEIKKENFQALIISSEGRHFSSGANINELVRIIQQDTTNQIPEKLMTNLQSFQILNQINKPVFAAISGMCIGSAFELALCADYRLITKNALFAFPEVSFALMPGLGGVSMLRHIADFANALEIVISGRFINSEEAINLGLANRIVEKKYITKVSIEVAKSLKLNRYLIRSLS